MRVPFGGCVHLLLCVCVGVCMHVSAVAHCFACLSVTEILEHGLQPVAKLAFAPK